MAQTASQTWLELRVLREKNGDSLTSLSQRSGVSLSYLSQLENGQREPNPRITKKLAVALNVPVSVLEKDRRDLSPFPPSADLPTSRQDDGARDGARVNGDSRRTRTTSGRSSVAPTAEQVPA